MGIIKEKIKWSKNYEFQRFLHLFSGTFRDNVRFFLREYCEVEDYKVRSMLVWRSFLVKEGGGCVVPLYTIEEPVNGDQEPCKHCTQSGCWNDHFVSKRKYHFIIPIDSEWDKALDDDVLRRNTHILHGLIHSNGFGHLLCLKGREGGSSFLRGREVMGLWDRICTALRCREISVVDMSKKWGMDLQLLYAASNTKTWFEQWGYNYCQGSSHVNKNMYDRALEELRSIGLDRVKEEIVNRYKQAIGTEFDSIAPLVSYMVTEVSSPTPQTTDIGVTQWAANLVEVGRIEATMGRCEQIARRVVEKLRQENAYNGKVDALTIQLRVRRYLAVEELDLLDYMMERINGVIFERDVVRRIENSETHVFEYMLQEIAVLDQPISKSVIYADLLCLYHDVLFAHSLASIMTVSDYRNFTKKWPPNADGFTFRVTPLVSMDRENLVRELLVVPPYATIGDIKREVELTMWDTYVDMENLNITEIVKWTADDKDMYTYVLEDELERDIWVRASEANNPEVKCKCELDQDDMQMVQCVLCGDLNHLECTMFDSPPPFYMCHDCYEQKVLNKSS